MQKFQETKKYARNSEIQDYPIQSVTILDNNSIEIELRDQKSYNTLNADIKFLMSNNSQIEGNHSCIGSYSENSNNLSIKIIGDLKKTVEILQDWKSISKETAKIVLSALDSSVPFHRMICVNTSSNIFGLSY